ncbi:MAG: DNA-binding protein [Eubacterium sp.]|nr:DNA-binding protein [Eubacterium sp.]
MDERLRKSLLYDFYGELLNEHQKAVFSAAIFDDMSYSELAEEFDCSRQAAFDLIRRINNKLEGYETKLGLLERFSKAKDKMQELSNAVSEMNESVNSSDIDKKVKNQLITGLNDITSMSAEIFEEF